MLGTGCLQRLLLHDSLDPSVDGRYVNVPANQWQNRIRHAHDLNGLFHGDIALFRDQMEIILGRWFKPLYPGAANGGDALNTRGNVDIILGKRFSHDFFILFPRACLFPPRFCQDPEPGQFPAVHTWKSSGRATVKNFIGPAIRIRHRAPPHDVKTGICL